MEAKEFRIGNWIYMSTEDAKYVKSNLLGQVKWKHIRNIEEQGAEKCGYRPIILTEEWLLKLGFRKIKLLGYDQHFSYLHAGLYSGVTALYNSDFSILLDGVARGIKYVHQLQNLYFALTGEEL